jgi:gluconokinase
MSNVLEEIIDGVESWPEAASVLAPVKHAALMSIDIGTSGVRAALFDETGRQVEGSRVKTTYHFDTTEISIFDADELVERIEQTIDLLLADNLAESPIELIAVSCFWHSLMGVDASGKATTPVLGWADSRASQTVFGLRSELDETVIHQRTGCRFHASYWPAKLRRLRDHEHEIFEKTARWVSFADYLMEQFCGESAVSVSMASGTGLFNQAMCVWDDELLEFVGVRSERLTSIAEPNRVFNLLPAYVSRWPQLADAQMYPAIGDGAANNLGSGSVSAERIALMIGTSGAMRVCLRDSPPKHLPSELWCYRADRDRILVGGALSDGGGLYDWIRRTFLPVEDIESIERELLALNPDAHGLTMLPFWSGERSTGWNPHARGAIVGITAQTRPIEILHAAMEAIAYRFALIATALAPGAPDAEFIASGNALVASQIWPQILADVLGKRVTLSAAAEASMRGAALLALEAAGKIQNIDELAPPVGQVFEPDPSNHTCYREALERQEALYKKLYG